MKMYCPCGRFVAHITGHIRKGSEIVCRECLEKETLLKDADAWAKTKSCDVVDELFGHLGRKI